MILRLGNPSEVLLRCMDPPTTDQVNEAIFSLVELGAIEKIEHPVIACDYSVTPLGFHLAQLSMDLRLGKMLITSSFFDCVEPILTIAAYLGGKSPILSPPRNEDASHKAHVALYRNALDQSNSFLSFTPTSQFSSTTRNISLRRFAFSDHLLVVIAFDQWNHIRTSLGKSAASSFCNSNFLSQTVMWDILDMRHHYKKQLESCGFLRSDISISPQLNDNSSSSSCLTDLKQDSRRMSLPPPHEHVVKSVICAGKIDIF